MIFYCNFNLRKVCQLSETYNIDDAARELNVSTHILKRFLARFSITDENDVVHILNYTYLYLLQDLPSTPPFYEVFIERNGGVIHNFAEMPLRKVHQIFQLSDTIEDCANALNIRTSTLQKWLQNKSESNDTAPLTFDSFHRMTEDYAQQLYRNEYDDLVKMPSFKIANNTLHQVHKALIISETLSEAAQQLNISPTELEKFISSFTDTANNVLTSSILRTMTIYTAEILFEEQYGTHDQSAALQKDELSADTSTLTVKKVHRVARQYQVGIASELIGIEENVLKRFLARLSFTNSNNCLELLSFERLRSMSEKDAGKLFLGEFTNTNPGRIPELNNFTVREFHQLLRSSSVKMLSIQFDTPGTALRRIIMLMLENPSDQVFDLIALKNTSTEEASKLFGNNYDKYINPNNVKIRTARTKVSHSSFFNQNKSPKNETINTSSTNNKKIKIDTNAPDSNDISNCNNNNNDLNQYNYASYTNDANNDLFDKIMNNYTFDTDEDDDANYHPNI